VVDLEREGMDMIVVTGAAGNVGRPLVRALVEAGERVIAISRRPVSSEVLAGVEHRQADLTESEQLASTFDGGDSLFLMDTGASAHLIDAEAILAAARRGGIGRVVLLSSLGVATRPESPSHGRLMRSVEEAVLRSGMESTILRPGGFASNALAWAESVRARRIVAAPFGDVGLPLVDPADIAAVAAAALRQPGHTGKTYQLTGPALITPRQQTLAISEALGEPVEFVEQSRAEARERMLRFMPGPVVETTLDVLGTPTPDEVQISPDVERILARRPRSFIDWANAHVAAFK
jgi:uncharacterized protein YbjT (DUF2867 family)